MWLQTVKETALEGDFWLIIPMYIQSSKIGYPNDCILYTQLVR